MIYQILFVVSVAFIILGIILAAASVYVFRRNNMAEIYDSLLNRGYTQRIEMRKNRRNKKYENANKTIPQQTGSNLNTAGAAYIQPQAFPPSYSSAAPSAVSVDNSDQTMPLNNFSFESKGLTTMLETQNADENFKIVKELYYSYSNETI